MKLLYVNVLVYAHREDVARHAEYRAWLEVAIQEAPDLALSGCQHAITHPKNFNQPTP